MLEFCEITKIFDTDLFKKNFTALNGLSFKIEEGKTIGFLGANGAGKTTTLKIGMDFIRPTSGSIIYGEALGGSRKNAFQHIGYLPERPFFYPHLTGREFSHYMGGLSNLSKKTIKQQIEYWSPRFKIDFALDRKIKNYSKGMLQRVGFLVTMLHDPKLIILDEPLSGLDPIGRKELRDIIVEINEVGKTVFFSSHIVSDVEEVCEKVIFIKNGKLVYDGNVDTIINDNLKLNSKIRFVKDSEQSSVLVDHNNVNSEIENLIKNQNQIISVEPNKPTLEEIFYSVK
jgi:ABC-2 type transport system ATP-binding protein